MKILLGGDIMMGENLFHLGRGILSKYNGRYTDLICPEVFDKFLSGIDCFVFNFEYSLFQLPHSSYLKPEERVYRGEIYTLDLINKFNGLKIANIANNHFSQHGHDSAEFTCATLTNNSIQVVGRNQEALQLDDIDGKVLKIWGVSLIDDPYFCNSYWYCTPEKLISFFNDINKQENEYWILSIHWGDEYIGFPSPEQVILAHMLVDSGVDLIVGHHPHVIQSIEQYKQKTIFYSFGNLIFDQNFSTETTTGLIAIFDTCDNSISKLYETSQNNYAVSSIKEVSPRNYSQLDNSDYSDTLKKNHKVFRLRMKFEYLKNFYLTYPGVMVHLMKRTFKKYVNINC